MDIVILKLVLGLILILVGANFLIDGASSVARKFGIPEFVVGLTIVGIGTSTPEMVVSVISALQGKADIAVGNVIGSNIANILLILGIVSIISPVALTKSNIRKDIPTLLLATLLLILLGLDSVFYGKTENIISRIDGLILFAGFIIFLIYSFTQKADEDAEDSKESEDDKKQKQLNIYLSIFFILGGFAGLIYGGQLFVGAGSDLASHLGASDAFIGITIMAIGTSLPELAASATAAIKKRGQMALGNIVGSNIANIFMILGGSAIITPLTLQNITLVDIIVTVAAAILMYISALTFKKMETDRWDGSIFVLCYIGYIVWLITQI